MQNEKKTVKTNQFANSEELELSLINAVQKLTTKAQKATISKNKSYTTKKQQKKNETTTRRRKDRKKEDA